MTIQVFTRSNNDELYDMMHSLIPADVECIKVEGYNNWTEAADYLYHILDTGKEWVVNCDIDCFIYDWPEIIDLVHQCNEFGTTHAGCRDGGEMQGRFHSWTHINPFLNIFNAKRIRELKKETAHDSWHEVHEWKFNPIWEQERPRFLKQKVFHDNEEPFAGLFYWLYEVGNPLFLRNGVHTDNTSTIVEDFAIHTWYSREFNYDPFHKQRILDAYEYAKSRRR